MAAVMEAACPARTAMLQAVSAHPGLTIQEVARAACKSHSTAAYHLRRLEADGLVVGADDGNKVRYYRNGDRLTERERGLLRCLSSPATLEVLDAVLSRPRACRADLAAQLGVAPGTISWHVDRLFECGVLTEIRGTKRARLLPLWESLRDACAALEARLGPGALRDTAARLLEAACAAIAAGASAVTLPAEGPAFRLMPLGMPGPSRNPLGMGPRAADPSRLRLAIRS